MTQANKILQNLGLSNLPNDSQQELIELIQKHFTHSQKYIERPMLSKLPFFNFQKFRSNVQQDAEKSLRKIAELQGVEQIKEARDILNDMPIDTLNFYSSCKQNLKIVAEFTLLVALPISICIATGIICPFLIEFMFFASFFILCTGLHTVSTLEHRSELAFEQKLLSQQLLTKIATAIESNDSPVDNNVNFDESNETNHKTQVQYKYFYSVTPA